MTKKIRCRVGLVVCALIGVLTFACSDPDGGMANKAAEQPVPAAKPASTIVKAGGVEVSLNKIDVVQEREVMPGFPDKMVAKPGRAFAVLHLAVNYSNDETKLDVQRLSLVDAAGNAYKTGVIRTNACDAKTGGTAECELPFDVPAGATFSKLRLDSAEAPIVR
jgi:hypothetical protein